jgi:hypothetical protein
VCLVGVAMKQAFHMCVLLMLLYNWLSICVSFRCCYETRFLYVCPVGVVIKLTFYMCVLFVFAMKYALYMCVILVLL